MISVKNILMLKSVSNFFFFFFREKVYLTIWHEIRTKYVSLLISIKDT